MIRFSKAVILERNVHSIATFEVDGLTVSICDGDHCASFKLTEAQAITLSNYLLRDP